MPAPESVVRLVERFGNELEKVRGDDYYEAALCTQYLIPLFEALGWDMKNENGLDEVREQNRLGGGSSDERKVPDYSFRIGSELKFYVDAKRPKVPVATDMVSIRQIRNYGWNRELLTSVISDFEHLAIYDTRFPILKKDTPDTALACRRFEFRDYIDRWDELYSYLGRDNVAVGSLEQLVGRKKKGVKPVDEKFLDDLEDWRASLARDIHTRNSMSEEQLTDAVQRILDRIVFLRFGEDRGFEPHKRLWGLVQADGAWNRFRELFRDSDARYDSELFSTPLSDIEVGDSVLKEIIAGLYEPAPYNFSVISPDILGSVYERFLGKKIHIDGRGVHIVNKSEAKKARKASGVYYTPTYIVDYIVANTVGRLVANKTPDEVSKLAIIDPACGSGSFLISAFQHLIEWHVRWYQSNDGVHHKGKASPLRELGDGTFDLTVAEKRRILLNNIFGLDIDKQAVEVAKLSLSLKLLENEKSQMQLFEQERVLPDLGSKNIKCGNALIGTQYFINKPDVTNEERAKINAFDWEAEFVDVFNRGGFDAIIGNPPYSSKQSVENKKLTAFFTSIEYKCDPFAFFIEQGLRKLRGGGEFGYIVPISWMTNFYYSKLRHLLVDSRSLRAIVLIDGQVFEDANIDTCLLFLKKEGITDDGFDWAQVNAGDLPTSYIGRSYDEPRDEERYDIVPNSDKRWRALKKKMEKGSVRLKNLAKISLGMKLKSNAAHISPEQDPAHPDVIFFGDDVGRYTPPQKSRYFKFKTAKIVGGTKNPAIQSAKPKILIQAIRNLSLDRRIVASIDYEGHCFVGTLNSLVLKDPSTMSYEFVLGLVNSRLLNEYFKKRFTTISLTAAFLGELPIVEADEGSRASIASLVVQSLKLREQQDSTTVESHQQALQRQIDAIDRQIDRIVYKLYGLSEEEIRIVEESAK